MILTKVKKRTYNTDTGKYGNEHMYLAVLIICVERITTLNPTSFHILIPASLIVSDN